MRFLAIDPRWEGGTPPDWLAQQYDGVRFVAFPELWPMVGHYLNLGLYVDLVLALESGDPAQYAEWGTDEWFHAKLRWIVGNEPDGSGASSWTMTPRQYRALFRRAATFLKGELWIAGMCSGDVARAEKYLQPGAAGLMVHIYTLTPEQADQKVREYMQLGLPTRVGEFHECDGYTPDDYWNVFAWICWATYFCYSDAMVAGMGLPQAA